MYHSGGECVGDNKHGYACVCGKTWYLLNFYCEPKTTLKANKNKVF